MFTIKNILILFIILGFNACQFDKSKNSPASQIKVKPKHVVIIGVDAMSPHGILNANTPVMDKLIKEGAHTFSARGVLPTSSSPNWKSMVSGAGPEQHGVTSNGWERDDFNIPPMVTGIEDIFPTIFGQFRQQNADAKIAAIYAWGGFGPLIERSALNYDVGGKSDSETAQLAAKYLVDQQPDLMFVHLDWVDHVGHANGHKTSAYFQAVAQADGHIGQIIHAAESAGMLKDTVFIITADHGGIGYGHGGESLDELEIPFIVYGAGVKVGHVIQQAVYTYDNAATVAHLLGVTPNAAWIGKPITDAFEGSQSVNDKNANSANSIAPPKLLPIANLYEPAGGFFSPERALLEIEPTIENAQIRYTLDGSEPNSTSLLYTDTVKLTGSALVKARQFNAKGQSSGVVSGSYQLIPTNSRNGIQYQYYQGDNWQFLSKFETLAPIATGQTYQFRIGDIPKRSHTFGIRYSAWINIKQSGQHKFYTYSDDGSKLYIDGEEVVNNDGDHGTLERSGIIELASGYHRIQVDYFNGGGGAWLEVLHKAPGQSKQMVKPELLFLSELK
jgi:hypothetical protein